MQIDVDLAERPSGRALGGSVASGGGHAGRAISPAGILAKHCLDFALALCGVVALLPVFALVAIAIKLDSPGPVFFRQKRAGRNGRLFDIFKFRTMIQGAYHMGSRLTVKRDPRITGLGKLLRWSKIDELPQLFNVVRGEMSLIGPRPEDPHFVELYNATQRRVLLLRPGIVGPSQIEGRDETEDYPEGLQDTERYYIDHILPPKLQRDLEYVQNATFWSDVALLIRGLWVTFRGAFKAKYLWRRRRRIALMGLDLVLVLTAYCLALVIRFEGQWPSAAEYTLQTLMLIALLRPPLLLYFGAYHGIANYFGWWDLVALFKAVSVGSIAIAGITYFVGFQSHPRSVFVIDWALLLFMLSGTRYLLRTWTRWHPRHKRARDKALIVGAGSGGEQIGRALIDDPMSGYRPVGFIDELHDRWGASIHGVKVLGGIAELRLALSANGIRVVFVCLSDLSESTARDVAGICAGAGVECRMLPALSELLNTDSFTIERSGFAGAAHGRGAVGV